MASAGHTIAAVEAFVLVGDKDYATDAGLATPALGQGRPASRRPLADPGELHVCIYPPQAQTCIVRLTTKSGFTGWGECHAPLSPRATAAIVLDVLAPIMIGQNPLAIEVLWKRMYGSQRLRGQVAGYQMEAIAGVDIALWDLAGKLQDRPVYELLGGPFRTSLPAYASGVPGATVVERVSSVNRFIDEGYTAIKASIGRGTIDEDLEGLAPLLEAAHGRADILVDAHGAYTAENALVVARELASMGAAWLEDPLPPEDIDGYARLCAAVDMPIASGETECTSFQVLDRLKAGIPDILLPDVCRAGGITDGRRIADLAHLHNRRWAAHVSMGSSIHVAAAGHLAAASSNFLIFEFPSTPNPIGDHLLTSPLRPERGMLTVPDGPGLGIEFDGEQFERHAIQI
ncbi:MAG: mandelate racemase/muconate lactonizing enzyme family protein [Chloroflexota bacterium]|nr:mandelate racemase/muconate lactonizing enzyme family protein [Chloroflexota bacterium]